MKTKEWLIVGALIATVPLVWWLRPGRGTAPEPAPLPAVSGAPPVDAAAAPVTAEPAASPPVVVIVALDPQVDSRPLMTEALALAARFGDDVAVVLRVVPPTGELAAARAHLAAEAQGRGQAYLERLLGAPADEAALIAHADALSLDLARFDRDRRAPSTLDRAERARFTMRALGVTAPGALIDGRAAPRSAAGGTLAAEVAAELAAAEVLRGRGAPRALLHEARARLNAGPLFQTYWQGLIDPVPATATPTPTPRTETPAVSARELFDDAVWPVAVHGREPAKGNPNALVTIVEFADFTCAWCARASEVVDQLLERHPGEVRVVWKTVVLASHERSRAAAEAALAAHDRGKFWPMLERIFAAPTALADTDLVDHGEALGLGAPIIERAIAARSHEAIVRADRELATRLGISGAPNFFVNGRRVEGFRELDDLELLVTEELAKARAMVSGGVPAGELYQRIIAKADAGQPLAAKVHAFTFDERPTRGAADGDIVITEFVDYQLYTTLAWDRMVAALLADRALAGRMKVVVKQLPHVAHPLGREAALAAFAAGEQGKFWPMHERLVALRGELETWTCETLARELGLDMDRYATAMRDAHGQAHLDQDVREGRAAGKVSGPALFLGGRAIEDEARLTGDELRRLIARYFPARR